MRIDLDPHTLQALQAAAERELRPVDMQAVVAVRRGLGLADERATPAPAASAGVAS